MTAHLTASTLRIVGLDLSITASGVCLPDGHTFTIRTRASDGDRRLTDIVDTIGSRLIDPAGTGYNVDLVVLEEAPPGLKGAAIKAIHMVHGAVRAWLIAFSIPYAEVNPSTLKTFATGNVRADKVAMAMSAFKRAGVEFADDNQCDAWWLRQAGLVHMDAAELSLPQAQLAALQKVAWPAVAMAVAS